MTTTENAPNTAEAAVETKPTVVGNAFLTRANQLLLVMANAGKVFGQYTAAIGALPANSPLLAEADRQKKIADGQYNAARVELNKLLVEASTLYPAV